MPATKLVSLVSLVSKSLLRMTLLAASLTFSTFSWGETLPGVTDKPILTVSGKIEVTNKDGKVVFNRAGFESLGVKTFTTSTPWYKVPKKFEGVPVRSILDKVGAKGSEIWIVAIDDYTTKLKREDLETGEMMLAIKRDGEYMPVSDKGPLWLVYNFDAHPELKEKKFYSRCAWQVARIEVH